MFAEVLLWMKSDIHKQITAVFSARPSLAALPLWRERHDRRSCRPQVGRVAGSMAPWRGSWQRPTSSTTTTTPPTPAGPGKGRDGESDLWVH